VGIVLPALRHGRRPRAMRRTADASATTTIGAFWLLKVPGIRHPMSSRMDRP
jgi:hypothetical protein